MSTPVRERDDDPSRDGPSDSGPLKYAPKRAKLPKADPDKELAGVNAAPTSETTESPDPPWLRKEQPGAFVADLNTVELRDRFGRGDRVSAPPSSGSSGSKLTATRRVTVIAATAVGVAAGVIGYRWSAVPPTSWTQQQPAYSGAKVLGAKVLGAKISDAKILDAKILDMAALESPAPVEGPRPPNRNDNLPSAQFGTTGLASWPPSSPTSTPPAPGPTVPLGRLGSSEPASEPSPQQPDAAQIAVMVRRGAEFMANGNIGAARVMLRPAAEAGDATAAFALAETYDPLVLQQSGAKGGITSDVALARRWYEAAKSLGSAAAPDRLVRLALRFE